MKDKASYRSDQEAFWAGDFGADYIARNRSDGLLASNLQFFSKALSRAGAVSSCVELGANVGMNLRALRLLYPQLRQYAVEINATAAHELEAFLGAKNVHHGSLLEWSPKESFDLSLVKGVLIHIDPSLLAEAYERIYESSRRLILIAEYYNPSPISLSYRGHSDKLFKRDFAGEILDRYKDVSLVDYGFCYRRDPAFPQDDITWFLMQKDAR